MKLYPLFVIAAAATVFSPGPGVVMTLSNAIRHGFRGAFAGILGVALGAFVVAAISATSVGVLLAASATAFTILKLVGAAYLVFLGVKLWRAPPLRLHDGPARGASLPRRFAEGFTMQVTNPKAIFFFLSVFPQFIDTTGDHAAQFTLLVLTYGALVIVIHCGYALSAGRARAWLGSPRVGRLVNRIGGAAFMVFGAALATARR